MENGNLTMTTDINFRSDMTVELVDSMGSDDSITRAMLVSTQGADAKEADATYGRINFLMANRHGTPFEHAALTFYAEVPIFVLREWHRHRVGVSYNELSGRYAQLAPTYYVPGEQRNLVQVGKPGHYEYVPGSPEDYDWLAADMEDEACQNYARYEKRLERGIAKEVARMGLGINIFSAQFFTCNPRSIMAFLSLRTKSESSKFPSYPQREIEMAAEMMETVFAERFPLTHRSFEENGRVSP